MQATASTTAEQRPALSGWPIVGWSTLVVVAIQLAIFALVGTDEQGVRVAIRASARTSVVLFGLAFTASSLYQLAPGAFTRWLLRNRRYLGVSFAVSHAIHLAAIVTLVVAFGAEVAAATLIVGGLGYVLIAAMAATSSDRAVKRLGARRWKMLHAFGARYVWLVFFVTSMPVSEKTTPARSLLFAFVVAMAMIRTAAWWKARSR